MGFYRTIGAIGALVGMNILVGIMKIPIETNYVFGNHITESLMIIGLLGLLLDLRVLNLTNGVHKQYLKLGLIAFIFGGFFEILSFASLMYKTTTLHILTEWIRIAPFTIALIGLPVLYISDRMSYRRQFLGKSSVGIKGLFFNFLVCVVYTILIGYFLFKFGILAI